MFITLTDQTGHTLSLAAPPRRIVSLVPSQTELLYELGLDQEVAGITRFCIHPETWFRTKKRIGGTKKLHLDIIRSLEPDLILANREENVREQVEELRRSFPVYTSDISNLAQNNEMICDLGLLTNRPDQASRIVAELEANFAKLKTSIPAGNRPTVLYLIWRNPYMSVGSNTFIHAMLGEAGFANCMSHTTRYPVVDPGTWPGLSPDLVFLSSEPYPFSEKHIEDIRSGFPSSQVMLVDGEMFSWYGSRIRKAPEYFLEIWRKVISDKL